MSILINLLPDIRQAKLRERRRRQVVSGISVLVWAICGSLVVLLTIYAAGQKVIISSLTSGIKDKEKQLQAVPGLVEALTAEQHLASLPALYQKRVYLTRFFQAYSEGDPVDVTLNALSVDKQNAMIVTGSAKNYAAVAKLARALAADNVRVGSHAVAANTPYFTNVNITNVSSETGGLVSFTLNATIDEGATSGSSK